MPKQIKVGMRRPEIHKDLEDSTTTSLQNRVFLTSEVEDLSPSPALPLLAA